MCFPARLHHKMVLETLRRPFVRPWKACIFRSTMIKWHGCCSCMSPVASAWASSSWGLRLAASRRCGACCRQPMHDSAVAPNRGCSTQRALEGSSCWDTWTQTPVSGPMGSSQQPCVLPPVQVMRLKSTHGLGCIPHTRDACSSGNEGTHTFVVADGDIDPEWVEALNSVLDDNRCVHGVYRGCIDRAFLVIVLENPVHPRRLTMPSGECIQLGNTVSFVFECTSLAHASPATVSRCGLLALTAQPHLGTAARRAWLATLPEAQRGWSGLYCHIINTACVKNLKHTLFAIQDPCVTGASSGSPGPTTSLKAPERWLKR